MRFGVVVFPGSNCDADVYHVIREVLGQPVTYLWHGEKSLAGLEGVVLPGGFSYGDYLRPGAIARFSPVMQAVKEFAAQGGFVLGICNGFQILLEAGLLPGAMMVNASLKFCCRDTYVRVENNRTPFTCLCQPGQVLRFPVAHYAGNYFLEARELEKLKRENQVVFRYCNRQGEVTAEANPNGSLENIAGICSEKGNILGLMPHPERSAEEILGTSNGKLIFCSLLAWKEGSFSGR